MRKNISSLLQKGNLRPKERVLLLVADQASKERDGKSFLTEADKHALSEGWTPKDNSEVKEYNRFNEGWKNAVFAELDAQTTYLTGVNSYLRASKYIDYIMFKNRYDKNATALKDRVADIAKQVLEADIDEREALNLVLKSLGLELDKVIYLLAFETAGESLQKDLLALDPDAKTEQNYLEAEEIIADLFNGRDELTKEAKGKLAELIVSEAYNQYAKEWRFDGYYAELPLLEVVKKWADDNKINYEVSDKDLAEAERKQKEAKDANSLIAGDKSLDTPEGKELRKEKLIPKVLTEKITSYAEKYKKDIRELLRETILKWLDEGLFTKDTKTQNNYTPIFRSDAKETCNEQDTKLTHKEVFKKWREVKAKAKATIQELIDKGELKVEKREKVFKNYKKIIKGAVGEAEDGDDEGDDLFRQTQTLITGESLYNFKGDFTFAKDFKKQAEDFKLLGSLILFLRECKFVKDYSALLAFEELFKRLSKTFETDLTYKIKGWIKSFEEDLRRLQLELLMIGDDIQEAGYKADRVYYLSESFIDELMTLPFDPDETKPNKEAVAIYFEKIKGILGDDF